MVKDTLLFLLIHVGRAYEQLIIRDIDLQHPDPEPVILKRKIKGDKSLIKVIFN